MIYLDHNATAPIRPEARAAMAGALEPGGGNPSSLHAAGRRARELLERARVEVASLCGAASDEIVFTSGGTEADRLAILGGARAARAAGRAPHVVSSPLEHPAVGGALAQLADEGFEITLVEIDGRGRIAPGALEAALRDDTALVTLAAANHELGNVYPVAALARTARARGAVVHSDAVQAAGRIDLAAVAADVDLLSLSAHKLGGPPGVGALRVRRGVALAAEPGGGRQERGLRPGTENLPGIVGFGAAAATAAREWPARAARCAARRERLERGLAALGARLHGDPAARGPNTVNAAFPGVDGELLACSLDLVGVCVSTGAACSSGSVEPSPVLLALGLPPAEASEGVRFSLGPETSAAEIDEVLALLPPILARVRGARAG